MIRHIFVLTGAGVSAESGLGTFRDKKDEGSGRGSTRWNSPRRKPSRAIPSPCSPSMMRGAATSSSAKPNAAHVALARLERELARQGGELTLVTQNIDDLHERAGSQRVLHMHGELLKARCRSVRRRRDSGRAT